MAEKSGGERLLVVEILDSWPRLWKLLLCIFVIVVLLGALAVVVIRLLNNSNASELQVGSAHILFQQPTKDGNTSVLFVFPQGWNQTEIQVKPGEKLRVRASGRVQTDLTGLIGVLEKRQAAENDPKHKGETFPEDSYSDKELDALTPQWEWVGPDGVKDMTHANRRSRAILTAAPYGTLVGAFYKDNVEPADYPDVAKELTAHAFPIGREGPRDDAMQPGSGYLYLAVNDIWFKKKPDLFFVDNIGAFLVHVEVTTK